MSQTTEYEQVTAFLEDATPAEVLAFRLSDATRERVADLIHREKTDGLSRASRQSSTSTCRSST